MGNVRSSSSWQTGATGGSFMADGRGRPQSSLYPNQHGSFMGSPHHQHGTQDTSFTMNMTPYGGSSLVNMKNVPSQGFGTVPFYSAPDTSKMILAEIDATQKGTYDFFYLPIGFKAFNGKKSEKFNSEKMISLAYARIQGRAALVAHFQNSSLMNEDTR
ncbi:hypothetical protein BHM03_00003338 [Ensete ventricosum]|nr:hypothetical protein BHM03_00003338 [Ensete ventricosum]